MTRKIFKCLNCGKFSFIYLCRLKEKSNRGRFCSRLCTDNFKRRFGVMKNENNPCWSGDKVSYNGLHRWLRNNFKCVGFCEWCGGKGKIRKTHLACITGKYTRNREDYAELCPTCHLRFDRSENKYISTTPL